MRWIGDRQECFLSDYQGRDLTVEAELALDAEGNFLAIRGSNVSNIGAYCAHLTPLRKGLGLMSGNYRIPAVHFRGRAVSPTPADHALSQRRPARGDVRHRAADRHRRARCTVRSGRVAPAQSRSPPHAMPYTNGVGITYDNGDYAAGMDRALQLADWSGFPARGARPR